MNASAIDDLDQIANELRVLWLALGNSDKEAVSDFIGPIIEHVYQLADRTMDVSRRLQEKTTA